MAKYFLNIRQSAKSDDMEGNITYNFDLETPLLFPFAWGSEKHEYKYLEIETNKNENEFYQNTDNKGGIGNKFGPLKTYWNLYVPDNNKGLSVTGINDKLTLGDKEGKIYLEPFHYELSTLKIKPNEITWKSKENFRVKLSENYFIRDESQGFNIEFNQIELEGEKHEKLRNTISDCIEKGQVLTLKFCSPSSTYFRKNYSNSQLINTLVIPENSLQGDQEGSTINNPNNSSSHSDKYFYLLVIGGIVVLTLLLFLCLFFLIKRPKSHK